MTDSINLTNCDKEPIHQLGKVQAYGGLIAFSEEWVVMYCSQNLNKFCEHRAEQIIGLRAEEILWPEMLNRCKQVIADFSHSDETARFFDERVFSPNETFDVSVHISGATVIFEFEYHQALVHKSALSDVRGALRNLSQTDSMDNFFIQACDTVSRFTGFDRIMLYHFHNDGSGEVIAENVKNDMDSFLGLRYPASDIPKQARKLYLRNLTRLIEDVNAENIEITSQFSAVSEPLDLSLSTLRAVSPIHIEYLRNMGVNASFSLSITVNNELWGLFACHHNSSRYISLEMRSIIEVFGEVFSLELASRLRNMSLVNTEKASKLHVQMMSSMNTDASIFSNLEPYLIKLQRILPCDAAFLWVDNKLAKAGAPISTEDAQLIIASLNEYSPKDIVCSDNIQGYFNSDITVSDRYAGFLAVPISRFPKDFVVFLRKEETQSITWAGNPDKPVQLGPNGIRLTPRKSFAAWQEIRKGYSAPWLQKDIGLAQALKQILLEVVIRNIDERERLVRESQQQQDVLVSELNHRVRNILGLISSVVAKTATGAVDVPEFRDVLGGRINSIAVAQNQLTERNWNHAPLKHLFEIELSAHVSAQVRNVSIQGPNVSIAPKAYTTLTLVVHELVTNALKHGALKDDRGRLDIEWNLSSSGELCINWTESEYENIPSTNKGFGSVIIQRSVPFDLGGKVNVEHHGSGMLISILIPPSHIKLDEPSKKTIQKPAETKNNQSNRKIESVLVLEDNMIIALDLEDTLTEASIGKVYIANNTLEAEKIIKSKGIDFAVLDVNLGGENSYSIGKLCQKLDIPFVFVTGYNELQGVKDNGFEKSKLLMKPVNSDALITYIKSL